MVVCILTGPSLDSPSCEIDLLLPANLDHARPRFISASIHVGINTIRTCTGLDGGQRFFCVQVLLLGASTTLTELE